MMLSCCPHQTSISSMHGSGCDVSAPRSLRHWFSTKEKYLVLSDWLESSFLRGGVLVFWGFQVREDWNKRSTGGTPGGDPREDPGSTMYQDDPEVGQNGQGCVKN